MLVGPSGCGKSTTLRMIAGLEDISEGDLLIGGKRMNDVEPKDRDIAMVFQSYALYPHMTVYDNMAFALKLRKTPKEEIDKTVREAAAILDITQYLDRKPKALSGGQRQRVAIGRAIVRDPQVFLMDEPLSNLDAKLRNQMRAEIIKLRQRINTTFIYVTHDHAEIIKLRQRIDTTFVYVTHDQTEAMTLGDRIVIMKDGFIQQIGTPQEVFDQPANLFVAGFIGSPQMNFFDGQLSKKDGKYQIQEGRQVPDPGGRGHHRPGRRGPGAPVPAGSGRSGRGGGHPPRAHLLCHHPRQPHHRQQGGRVRDDGQRGVPPCQRRGPGRGAAHPHRGAARRAPQRHPLRHRHPLHLPS